MGSRTSKNGSYGTRSTRHACGAVSREGLVVTTSDITTIAARKTKKVLTCGRCMVSYTNSITTKAKGYGRHSTES